MTNEFISYLCRFCKVECEPEPCDIVHKYSPTFFRCHSCGKRFRFSGLVVEVKESLSDDQRMTLAEDWEFSPMTPDEGE